MGKLLTTAKEHTVATTGIALVAIVLVGWLAWLFQPWQLFLDTEVDEAFPVVAAAPDEAMSDEPMSDEPTSDEAMSDEPTSEEPMTDQATFEEPMADEPTADEPMSDEPTADAAAPAAPAGPVLLFGGMFQDRSHPTSGKVGIYELADGSRTLRIEDLETDSGPDLFVYLSDAAADAPSGDFDDNFVNLGRLKGNLGNQNYEIPADVDLSAYASVVIWCDRFNVVFGAADLSPA